MPRYIKTAACGLLAAGSFCLIPFDPTLTAAATFVASSTGVASGLGYHGVRKTREAMRMRRPNNPLERAQVEAAEAAIRKLSSAVVGCGIQGTLSLVLPQCLVGLAINGVETMYRTKQLRKISKHVRSSQQQGTKLRKALSKRNIAYQIAAGACIRGTSTALFMGTELDTWIENMDWLTDTLPDLAPEPAEVVAPATKEEGGNILQIPVDHVKEWLGEVPGTDWTWDDDKPSVAVAAVGLTQGAVETVAGVVVEVPLHSVAGEVSGVKKG